jgi:ParB family chromosome partitioning protein
MPAPSSIAVQKVFSSSNLMIGVVEEIDIFKIKISPNTSYFGAERFETRDLGNSIVEHGLLQPIIIRTVDDYFEIVSGNRRYIACKNLGWRKITCHVVELDDKTAYEVLLTENIQRKTLDPLEEAKAFKLYIHDFGFGGINNLAKRIGKSSSYICKRLNLLDLPNELLQGIQNLSVKPSIAEELLPIHDDYKRKKIAKIILNDKLNTKETRDLVNQVNKEPFYFDKNDSNASSIDVLYRDSIIDIDTIAQRAFDKSITTLKIAMNKIANIMDNVEDNWIIYEILMQHKNMISNQIDLLIKQKKKI